ncbi:AMP-binding protein, partial [Nocardioides kribbensis]
MTFTFAGALRDLASRTPDATAILFEEQRLSFADLYGRGTRLAHVLDGLGVADQRRVGFLGKNSPAFFELALACSLQDAVLVGLNWRLSRSELVSITADADLSLLVVSPDLVHLVDADAGVRVVTTGPELDALVAAADDTPVETRTRGESVLLQFYSSGTTGLPKGTLITNDNLAFTRTSGRLLY